MASSMVSLRAVPQLTAASWPRWLGRRGRSVGVDLSPEGIALAQIEPSRYRAQLTALASLGVPEGAFQECEIADPVALAERIRAGLGEHNLKPRQAAAAVLAQQAFFQPILLPAGLEAEALREALFEREAPRYLPEPLAELAVDYQVLDTVEVEGGQLQTQVLLVALRRAIADRYWETFQQAGLELAVLEIDSFAQLRALRERLRPLSSYDAAMLLDIGGDRSELTVVVDGVPQSHRTLPLGCDRLQPPTEMASTELTATTPQLPDWVTLAEEIERSVALQRDRNEGIEVVQLLLAGAGASIEGLARARRERLQLPVVPVDPLEPLSEQQQATPSNTERPRWTTAIGLALRAAREHA
ncbi:MAG: hypothetical protein BRC58_09055 [Cyanobacteria bacterium QS_8_64_29]|nr:MAG: hypothetical protein BRC58_09055 [Cyanobacteria bacterium QS_8_64_29]